MDFSQPIGQRISSVFEDSSQVCELDKQHHRRVRLFDHSRHYTPHSAHIWQDAKRQLHALAALIMPHENAEKHLIVGRHVEYDTYFLTAWHKTQKLISRPFYLAPRLRCFSIAKDGIRSIHTDPDDHSSYIMFTPAHHESLQAIQSELSSLAAYKHWEVSVAPGGLSIANRADRSAQLICRSS